MNAIEIRDLRKNFGEKQAVAGLNMTVPRGSIYGFIGENGSGKSTTEKMICGLLIPSGGTIKLNGKDYTDIDARAKIGVLIESPGCFPNMTVWNNLILQATNLNISNPEDEIRRVLKLVRMEGSASNKYKNCSLGMKQRIGIAMALMGSPEILVLDEPINGLDADGNRIMREVLTDLAKTSVTILISSHILSELEKIATHYGIIREGKMIKEMTAEELDKDCPTYISLQTKDMQKTKQVLSARYKNIKEENEHLRIYDKAKPEDVVEYLFKNNIVVNEITTDKISLEEYYTNFLGKHKESHNTIMEKEKIIWK